MFKQKRRLLTFISVLLITGFLLTSFFSYFVSVTSLKHHVTSADLPLTSDNVFSEIQRDLLRPIFISSLMASDTFLRDWIISGENSKEAIIRYLQEIKSQYGAFTAFFVSEETRNYYHPDGVVKQVTPKNQRDLWYFRVRELTTDYEINVDIDEANSDMLTVFINYRVYDYEKQFIGVTGVGLTVNAVQQLISRYQQIYDRDIIFIDRQGQIKLSNNLLTGDKQDSQLLDLIQSERFIEKIASSDYASFEYDLGGHSVSINSRFIEEFGWYLVVLQRELKEKRKLLKTLFLNLAFCVFITCVVLIITNRTISSYQDDIELMATTDKLTGLYNRQALDLLFDQLIFDQSRSPAELALFILDIDHFKHVNDSFGHLAGDAVLEHFASLTVSRLRQMDIVCRWGGEEFLVLLKGCDLETAWNMAEELRLGILNNPLTFQKQSIAITVSVGVTTYQPEDTRDKMISRADKALYKAKQQGRNQVVSA